MRILTAIITALWLLALSACQPAPAAPASTLPAPDSLPSASPSPTATSNSTPTPAASPTPAFTPTPAVSAVSSPIEGVTLAELPQIVSNPFSLPLPGRDDGHHGTDFAFYRWGDRVGMLGTPIHAVFDGRVAAVIANRPPYGNMVIVETLWPALPAGVQAILAQPFPPTPVPGSIRLTCPGFLSFPSSPDSHPSLYLLYAHMKETPNLKIGDRLTSGQAFGLVGTTGNSVNPHLHLETRGGPPGAAFPAMAHYIATATEAEMEGYCTWRVSGAFPMFDPIQVLAAAQAH